MGTRLLLCLLAVAAPGGCKQTKTLVLASVSAVPAIPGPSTVTLKAGTIEQGFLLKDGLGAQPRVLGVYEPPDVRGMITVSARATIEAGCSAEAQTGVTIDAVGTTIRAELVLRRTAGCGGGGGDGGAGNEAGPEDAQPAGAEPPARDGGAPPDAPPADGQADASAGDGPALDTAPDVLIGAPTLARCKEFLHRPAGACDPAMGGEELGVQALAFSPDGRLLGTSTANGNTRFWTLSGTDLLPGGPEFITNIIQAMAFSPDSTLAAGAGASGEVNLWHLADGMRVFNASGGTDAVRWAAFARDNDRFFTAQLHATTLRVWSGRATMMVSEIPVPSIGDVAASLPNPATGPFWVAVGDDTGKVSFLDAEATPPSAGAAVSVGPAGKAPKLALSPDARTLAVATDDGLYLWDVTTRTAPVRLEPRLRAPEAGTTYASLAFSPSGRLLVSALTGPLSEMRIYSVDTRAQLSTVATKYPPVAAAFSMDSRGVAVGQNACGVVLYCRD